ncbi:uroporphyrinogen-III C-methyltransferase [Rubrivivax gelatinosus]|nr:uroporphyrinogen-III C-methyltransferase [Rubrivivax gelatinosus]
MNAYPETPYLVADHEHYGHVTLLGAGPGDPELLTLKGAKALQRSSLVLHDHLVSDEILALAPASAERLYVGKESSRHSLPQQDIIELMLRLARSGRSLVRLKGGDGYIFGRGGEEAIALAEAGVPFDVIPGLSAAQGAGASAGIPLTHRDHAGALVFATGHLRSDRSGVDLDWDALARPRQTLVIYMGVGTLALICRELVAHGLPADTPAAIVERATLPDERCLVGTVATLPQLAQHEQVRTPALIIIGTVVGLRPLLLRERRQLAELEACA